MSEIHKPALLACRHEDGMLRVYVVGDWLLENPRSDACEVILLLSESPQIRQIVIDGSDLEHWDSSLLVFIYQLLDYCQEKGINLDCHNLPEGARRLIQLATAVPPRGEPDHGEKPPPWLESIGQEVIELAEEAYGFVHFAGEATVAGLRFIRGRARYRSRDFWLLLQECGPQALPIVSLIALLVGLILAYVGAIQLQMFGAQIYVANLVGLGTVREMGAMMTAVIMAGRTGSAYAAQLGTMQVNEEIDALKTLGLSPMEFLVLPRMLALILMVPLLTLYADLVGMIGGALASVSLFDVTLLEYAYQTQTSLDLSDIMVGLVKAAVFGVLIAAAGCMRGIQCQRSAQSVGEAATSAVVTSIVAIVVADALLTVLFTRLGI